MKILASCLTTLLLSSPLAHAASEPSRPFPRLELGQHNGPIRHIAVDAAGKWLVTGSEDKTARVWSLATGELARVLRPPVGSGELGKVLAVAMTPDGKTVAVGGITEGNVIYLFDRASGQLQRSIKGASSDTATLAFSRDGARIAAGLVNGNVQLWRTRDGGGLGTDTKCGAGVYGLSFDKAGRLATSCPDGLVRLYDAKLGLVNAAKAPGGSQPFGVSFSPDGTRLAVGYNDVPVIDVLSTKDLSPLFKPDVTGFKTSTLIKAVWSADGKTLYAAGTANVLRIWSNGGQGTHTDARKGTVDMVTDLAAVPAGVAFSAGDPAWGLVAPDGKRLQFVGPAQPEFVGLGTGFRVSIDGLRVRFALEPRGRSPVEFNVATRELKPDPAEDAALQTARETAERTELGNWRGGSELKLNGKSLGLEHEPIRTLAISGDGTFVVAGTNDSLRSFSLPEGKPRWLRLVPAAALATNISADGRLVVTAYQDGTIRWQRTSTGAEVLALFVHPDGKRWVLWTPSGYYDASEGAESLLGWVRDKGPGQAAELLPSTAFHARFYRPDVVSEVLKVLDEDLAVEVADKARPVPRKKKIN
jgi:WD40 repeat protein